MVERGLSSSTKATSGVADGSPDSARGFARGVGFVMQAAGAAVFMASVCACCGFAFIEGPLWSTTGRDGGGAVEPPATMMAMAEAAARGTTPAGQRGYAVLLFTSAVGALALAGFGIGQQADRGVMPSLGGAVVSTVMTGAYGLSAYLLWQAEEPRAAVVLPTALAAGALGVTALAWPALVQVLRHPPATASAPTVRGEEYPDPWATPRTKAPLGEGPTRGER